MTRVQFSQDSVGLESSCKNLTRTRTQVESSLQRTRTRLEFSEKTARVNIINFFAEPRS